MRDLRMLRPELLSLYSEFARKMALKGLSHIVTCTLRTQAEHDALYAQGREPLEAVNALRRKAGLWTIGPKENLYRVTWTQKTKHFADDDGFARAFDIALISPNGRPHWDVKVSVNDDEMPDYEEAAEIGRKVGLRAGFDFGDPCHFELKG